MKQINELRIFLASPSDVEVERAIVYEVLSELNNTFGTPHGISLKLINWELYSFPAIGTDPQDVINNQLPMDYDVFVCIFWTRIGTPTSRSKSGTIEEFENALSKIENGEDVEIMGFFKTEPPLSLKDLNEQFLEVRQLQKDFGKTCLYKEFTSTEKFKEVFRISFSNYLNKKYSKLTKKQNSIPMVPSKIEIGNERRNEIYLKLKSLNLENTQNADFFDTLEVIADKSNELTISLESISRNMEELTKKVVSKTEEMNFVNRISDTKLRFQKSKTIANQLANELDVISDNYDVFIPDFKEHYKDLIQSFIKIFTEYEKYMSEKEKMIKTDLISSIDGAIESLTDLLVEMDKVPKITSKYGQAHIRQMKLLKDLVEELLYGRELLDQIE